MKQIIFFFVVLYMINACAALAITEEEEYTNPSKDIFSQMEITSTIFPSKTVSTQSVETSNTIPSDLPPETSPTKTIVTMVENSKTPKFHIIQTYVPSDVEDVYALCFDSISEEGQKHLVKTPKPYLCNEEDMRCYQHYHSFNYTKFRYTAYCDLYTKKGNDTMPTPSNLDSVEMTSLCMPAPYTKIDTYSRLLTSQSEIITDEYQSNVVTTQKTFIYTYSFSSVLKTDTIVCSSTTTPVKITATINGNPKPKPYTLSLPVPQTPTTPITNEIMHRRLGVMTVKDNVEGYAEQCYTTTERNEYPLKTKLPVKNVPNVKRSLNKNHKELGICETNRYCYEYYTETIWKSFREYHETTHISCYYYTHGPEDFTKSYETKTSICKPTPSYRPFKATSLIDFYANVTSQGDKVTSVFIDVDATYDDYFTHVVCNYDVPAITSSTNVPTVTSQPTTTTLPPKRTPVISKITEKEKVTVTDTETVNVTVNGNANPTDTAEKEEEDKQQCAKKWEQCGGGQNYHGPTCCQAGGTCRPLNQYYSQCV